MQELFLKKKNLTKFFRFGVYQTLCRIANIFLADIIYTLSTNKAL
jgi:hypothetical protein